MRQECYIVAMAKGTNQGMRTTHHMIFTTRLLCLLLLCPTLFLGCSSYVDLSSSQMHIMQGNYDKAYQNLQMQAPSLLKAQGPIIVNYDLGMLARLNKNYQESNNLLSESERLIREAYTQSITANIASFIVNDNTKAYQGEEYEDIYLNLFKALNFLALGQEESALVELNRSMEKQALLKQKYEQYRKQVRDYASQQGLGGVNTEAFAASFSTSALTNYLASLVAQSLGESSTAYYAKEQVKHAFASQPQLYRFSLPSSVEQSDPQKGKARLHLLSFSGQAPQKQERWEYFSVSPTNHAKIAYPVLVGRYSNVQSIRVKATGQEETVLQKIESISDVAIDTFRSKSELAKTKAVLRAMAKAVGIAIYDSVAQQDEKVTAAEELLGLIFRVAQDVSERADVRSTHFLPSEAWVGSIDLDPGVYDLEFSFLNASGRVLHTMTLPNQEVKLNALNLCETYYAP